MKKIIFSDYDGTLDTSEEDIIKNIEAIRKFREKGNLFVIATGRSYLDLKRKLDIHPIPYDYLIVNHGSVILNDKNEIIDVCIIKKEKAIEILKDIKLDCNVERISLFDAMRKDLEEVSDQLTKILLEMKNEDSAKKLSNQLNEKWKDTIKSYAIPTHKYDLVEIIPKETDKGKAIEKILQKEKINIQDVYPIGMEQMM